MYKQSNSTELDDAPSSNAQNKIESCSSLSISGSVLNISISPTYSSPIPSPYQLSLLSAEVYEDHQEVDNLYQIHSRYKENLPNWEIVEVKSDKESGYYGIRYKHSASHNIVVAHRGTYLISGSIFQELSRKDSSIHTDLKGVGSGYSTSQENNAQEFTKQSAKEALDAHAYLTITGHSLGGWLAVLGTRDYFATSSIKPVMSIVTFDSPGTHNTIVSRKSNLTEESPQKSLEGYITTYLSDINIVNSYDKHVGRVLKIMIKNNHKESVNSAHGWIIRSIDNIFEYLPIGATYRNYFKNLAHSPVNFAFNIIRGSSVESHKLTNIIESFDETTGNIPDDKILQVKDWPSTNAETDASKILGIFKPTLNPFLLLHKIFSIPFLIISSINTMQKNAFTYFAAEAKANNQEDNEHTEESNNNITAQPYIHYNTSRFDPYSDKLRPSPDSPDYYLEYIYKATPNLLRQKLKDVDEIRNAALDLKQTYEIIDCGVKEIKSKKINDTKYRIEDIRGAMMRIQKKYMDDHDNRSIRELLNESDTISGVGLITEAPKTTPISLPSTLRYLDESKMVGRSTDLDQLGKLLQSNKIVNIHGIPGVGKSSFALLYLRNEEKINHHVETTWVSSESSQVLSDWYRNNLSRLLDIQNAPNHEEFLINLVNHKLRQSNQDFLFVFDNVTNESFEQVTTYTQNLPEKVKLIFTSRCQLDISRPDVGYLKVKPLTKEAAIEYIDKALNSKGLRSKFTQEQQEKMYEVISKVDSVLPIDLSIIDRAINKFRFSASFNMIMDYIANNLTDHFKAIYISSNEWSMLEPISYLSGSFISPNLLHQMGLVSEILFNNILETLHSQGYISVDNDGGIYIHEIMQDRFIEHTKVFSPESAGNIISRLLNFFDEEFPEVSRIKDEKWEKAASLLSHAIRISEIETESEDLIIHKAHILNKIGEYISVSLFDFEKSLSYHQKSLELVKTIDNTDNHLDLEIAKILHFLVLCYYRQEHYIEGGKWAREEILILEKLHEQNIQDIEVKRNLVSAYNQEGRVLARLESKGEALEFVNKAIETLVAAASNEDKLLLLEFYNDKLGALVQFGDFDQALEIAKLMPSLSEILLAEGEINKNDLTGAYNNISIVYASLKDYENAAIYMNKAIENLCAIYPDGHPDIAKVHLNLAISYSERKQYEEAVTPCMKALEMFSKYEGFHQPKAITYNQISGLKRHLKDYESAVKHAKSAIEENNKVQDGQNGECMAASLCSLGDALALLGDDKYTECDSESANQLWKEAYKNLMLSTQMNIANPESKETFSKRLKAFEENHQSFMESKLPPPADHGATQTQGQDGEMLTEHQHYMHMSGDSDDLFETYQA